MGRSSPESGSGGNVSAKCAKEQGVLRLGTTQIGPLEGEALNGVCLDGGVVTEEAIQ
jgi:hypothetical protein